jgi:integrase
MMSGNRTKRRHNLLKDDADVKRWYDNLVRGSRNTASVRLRRLGLFCEQNNTTPQKLVLIGKKDNKKVEDILFDHITYMESMGLAPGYIENTRKAIKSWLEFNYIELKRKIKIKNATIPVTLQDEKIPEKKELQSILDAASPRARTAISFIAFAGLRPQSLGDDIGSDGIKLSDISDLVISNENNNNAKIHFKNIPALIAVRPSLSKAGHKYFTFLTQQGCQYLLGYLSQRISHGEILTPESPIIGISRGYQFKRIQNTHAKKSQFITTTTIRNEFRSALRVVIKERPYVLRSYFDTNLLLAESHGKIAHDFRVFFMGHKGSMEARYHQ